MTASAPPDEGAVREACRYLEGQPGITVCGELRWFDSVRAWALPIRLTIAKASSEVPSDTLWYALVDARFPYGMIEFFPARDGGLKGTRPHQDINTSGDAELPWTEGDICVRAPTFVHGRHGDDPDPRGQPERLLWYANRARSWLEDAAAGTLLREGDHFELPQFSAVADTVGFCEDSSTLSTWLECGTRCGRVELVALADGVWAARRFFDLSGRALLEPAWGSLIRESNNTEAGGWIRLDCLPLLAPYQAPESWTDLWNLVAASGIQPEEVFRAVLAPLRDGKSHILLVGFPIPVRVGERASLMRWQPLRLPSQVTSTKAAPGFRGNEQGLWSRDQSMVLKSKKALAWLSGDNWHPDVLGGRGRLSASLRTTSITLLGAGALGSSVAELLVRGGVFVLQVVDSDRLSMGNLTRHSLSTEDVGQYKAQRLARRLNGLSPFARVTYSNRKAHAERLADGASRRLVLDCTGSDDVLQQLSAGDSEPDSVLVSLSLGLGAKRLYAVAAAGLSFPFAEFSASMQPWLAKDLQEHDGHPLPHGAPGCWHPLFPARADEVSVHAAMAVAELERLVTGDLRGWTLRVMERRVADDGTVAYGPCTNGP